MKKTSDDKYIYLGYMDGVERFDVTGMTDTEIAKRTKEYDSKHECFPSVEVI